MRCRSKRRSRCSCTLTLSPGAARPAGPIGDRGHRPRAGRLAVISANDKLCAISEREFQDLGPLMRRLTALVAAALAVCLPSHPALAGTEKRVALIIGNSAYQNVAALTNPANDAAAVTEMFKKGSFAVDSR